LAFWRGDFGFCSTLGVALISHGGADAKAIKNAVRTAGVFVEAGINRQISDRLQGTNAHIIPLKVSA
jgi:fatty acid/phospholipid biosynthesis enzyme